MNATEDLMDALVTIKILAKAEYDRLRHAPARRMTVAEARGQLDTIVVVASNAIRQARCFERSE